MRRRDCSLIPIEERKIELHSSYWRIDAHVVLIATREEQVRPAIRLLKPGSRFRFGDGLLAKLSYGGQRYSVRSSWDWPGVFQRLEVLREHPGTVSCRVHLLRQRQKCLLGVKPSICRRSADLFALQTHPQQVYLCYLAFAEARLVIFDHPPEVVCILRVQGSQGLCGLSLPVAFAHVQHDLPPCEVGLQAALFRTLLRDSYAASPLAGGLQQLFALPVRLRVLSERRGLRAKVFFTEEKPRIGDQASL